MLQVIIDGRARDRAAVLAWEARRMRAVRKKLRLPPSTAPIEEQRRELTDHKLSLGQNGVRALISRGLRVSEKLSRLTVAISGKSRGFSVCEIAVVEGSAERFARWFTTSRSSTTSAT